MMRKVMYIEYFILFRIINYLLYTYQNLTDEVKWRQNNAIEININKTVSIK